MGEDAAAPVEAPAVAGSDLAGDAGGGGAAPAVEGSDMTTPVPPGAEQSEPAERPMGEREAEDMLFDLDSYRDHKVKVRIDGKEERIPLSELLDQDHLDAHSMRRSASKRYSEAAEARKRMESFLTELDQDPLSILEKRGDGTVEKLARRLLGSDRYGEVLQKVVGEIEAEGRLSPEERDLRRREKELEAFKRQKEEWEAERQKERLAAQEAKLVENYTKSFSQALEARKIKPTPELLARMAFLADQAADRGHQIDANVLAQRVVREGQARLKAFLASADEATLEEMLGADGVKKLRRRDASRVAEKTYSKPKNAPNGKPKYQSLDDFADMLRKSR